MAKKDKTKKQDFPLFEYAQRFDNFPSFDNFDHYFAHCIQTSGFKMRDIAGWMHLSDTALSIRLNQIDPTQPRFNSTHIDFYIIHSGDPRPAQYLEWRSKQAEKVNQGTVIEKLARLLPHLGDLRALCDALEEK